MWLRAIVRRTLFDIFWTEGSFSLWSIHSNLCNSNSILKPSFWPTNHKLYENIRLIMVYLTWTCLSNAAPSGITFPSKISVVCIYQWNQYTIKQTFLNNKLEVWHIYRMQLAIPVLPGPFSPWKHRLISIGIPIIKIRLLSDRLRLIMGIPIPLRRRPFGEKEPSSCRLSWFSYGSMVLSYYTPTRINCFRELMINYFHISCGMQLHP